MIDWQYPIWAWKTAGGQWRAYCPVRPGMVAEGATKLLAIARLFTWVERENRGV